MENTKTENQPEDQNKETIFSPDEFTLQGYDKHIRQARNAIFAVAILLVISLLILCFTIPEEYQPFLWIDILLWSAFIAGFIILGFWTKKRPYYAIIGAIILYIIFIGLNAFLDTTTLYKGLVMKIIVFVLLFKGINDAKEAQELKQTFDK